MILEEHLFNRTANSGYICSKQKPVQSKILQQGQFVPISSCLSRQVFVHCLMSILMICKQTDDYIYQRVAEKLSFAGTCSKKKKEIDQKNFLLWQQLTELY